MNGLEEEFYGVVDFFHLNFDNPDMVEVLSNYNVRRRATYALLDAEGQVITVWSGPIRQEAVTSAINEAIIAMGR